ncbi:HPP family protein [Paenibacillus harenae]|uniref:HPP family protein n=1 Tax=Paenibacillus harenae TaxID=306543 RepID=UPI000421B889|nr:HPP family protein [Paenibacillus harenae]
MWGKIMGKPLLAAAGGTLAIALLLYLGDAVSLTFLMAPFGASCVIAFVLPESPLAKPRSIIGGHIISTAIGLAILHLVGTSIWSMAFSVGLSILLMQYTRTVHPPAGADPLVVLLSGASWSFLVTPVLIGAVLISVSAYLYRKVLTSAKSAQTEAGK